MKRVVFSDDEMRVISMFDTSSKHIAMQAVEDVVPFTREDPELSAIVISTVEKLKQISDEEFVKLDIDFYRYEDEEEIE